jgi:hypothetical protein
MPPYGNMTLAEIVDATERRAASGETVHPGFDFASMAPSPLKVAQQEAAAAEVAAAREPDTQPASAQPPVAGSDDAQPRASIDSDLDNAWSRLKRSINPS